MNIYLTLAWLWRLQMCLLFNYEHLLDPGLWRLQMCLLFNSERLLDLGLWRLQSNAYSKVAEPSPHPSLAMT